MSNSCDKWNVEKVKSEKEILWYRSHIKKSFSSFRVYTRFMVYYEALSIVLILERNPCLMMAKKVKSYVNLDYNKTPFYIQRHKECLVKDTNK